MRAAKDRGQKIGRPSKLTNAIIEDALEQLANSEISDARSPVTSEWRR